MTGVRFKDWETFLRYVGSQEKMKHKEEWRKAAELWDMDDLEPGEWKGMEKILSPSDYEELAMRLGTVEVRSFRLPFESDGMIFYAAGKEEGDGGYFCMGYGFVNESDIEDKNNRFRPMPEESNREKDYYYIGTERDYWETYPVLQTYLPEKILEYLASQVAILDSNYGADRDVQGGMGGFCAVIPKLDEAAKKAYRQILEKHYIQESMYEYLDTVTVGGTDWVEALYLTNNDYGIILIYQKGVEA